MTQLQADDRVDRFRLAACADPALLPLVDAAFTSGKVANAAARELATHCRTCPIAPDCREDGWGRQEVLGVWGGTRRNTLGIVRSLA